MLSLYLHIPFCSQKCAYCSFTVIPVALLEDLNSRIEKYVHALKQEIQSYWKKFPNEEINTIYFGGGTPNLIGADNLIEIINEIKKHFNTENVAEISFEFNPFPQEELYTIIEKLNKEYQKEARLRFSFGIQSFDDEVLKSSGRATSFGQLTEFLRWLQKYKQENNIFNFDFIAFGKFNETRSWNFQLRDQSKIKFFENFVKSGFADSFSIYTLELFEWSKRYNTQSKLLAKQKWTNTTEDLEKDNLISEEFQILKEIVLEAGYHRYETSNFAHLGKNSIHNIAYRTMENYLGLGLSAASFVDGVRFTNTKNINTYLEWNRLDQSQTIKLTPKDYLIEKFFLSLRTNQWIKNINEFKEILVPNYEKKIKNYQKEWFIQNIKDKESEVKLTDAWMDVCNTIIIDLLQEI